MEAKWMRQMSLRAAEVCELAAQRFSGQPDRVAELLATAADARAKVQAMELASNEARTALAAMAVEERRLRAYVLDEREA